MVHIKNKNQKKKKKEGIQNDTKCKEHESPLYNSGRHRPKVVAEPFFYRPYSD